MNKKLVAGFTLLAGCFFYLYYHVIAKLVYDWSHDDNYSHGFLIVPIAVYFIWERRNRLKEVERNPSNWGILFLAGSLASLLAGILGSELFLTRVSILGTIAGSVLFLAGWKYLRILLLPIAFLFLMIPIPVIIFNQIAFPLQLLASRFGETALMIVQVPVLREGNVIHLANTSLEVAEACSGIRSLISLLTLGIVFGYFIDSRLWIRLVLGFGTVPIAIAANGIRVAGTGIAAHFYGNQAAEGFFHSFSGWILFIAAFVMMFLLHRILVWIAPKQIQKPS